MLCQAHHYIKQLVICFSFIFIHESVTIPSDTVPLFFFSYNFLIVESVQNLFSLRCVTP